MTTVILAVYTDKTLFVNPLPPTPHMLEYPSKASGSVARQPRRIYINVYTNVYVIAASNFLRHYNNIISIIITARKKREKKRGHRVCPSSFVLNVLENSSGMVGI